MDDSRVHSKCRNKLNPVINRIQFYAVPSAAGGYRRESRIKDVLLQTAQAAAHEEFHGGARPSPSQQVGIATLARPPVIHVR
ncbi:unnamed protein product, partial [Nesidiocoris tenuis]